MEITNDPRTVVTLDAGGTNFVFSAMRGGRQIIEPITLPAHSDDLPRCLGAMVGGFQRVIDQLGQENRPAAISFAFPGPADYEAGIIGGYLPNFPSFRDGVALGPFLRERFGLPVYINNDGDLYALGEAMGGVLPEINRRLEEAGSQKRYRNLLGYTFGTGFGIGSVIDGRLNRGNNACVETFCLRHKFHSDVIAEEGVSVRAIIREYAAKSAHPEAATLTPFDIFQIAEGTREGDREAAREAFAMLGTVAGDAIATAVTLTDSLVVIGGGLTGAAKYFLPALIAEMRGKLHTIKGEGVSLVQPQVFNLDDPEEFAAFARGNARPLKVYGTELTVAYDPVKRTGVAISRIGASRAISLGAYAFALSQL